MKTAGVAVPVPRYPGPSGELCENTFTGYHCGCPGEYGMIHHPDAVYQDTIEWRLIAYIPVVRIIIRGISENALLPEQAHLKTAQIRPYTGKTR
ncbi:MAG: hypothetical protein PVJ15_03475 [Gammaproteobacteria bacterium]|jgi:hypothetical protein